MKLLGKTAAVGAALKIRVGMLELNPPRQRDSVEGRMLLKIVGARRGVVFVYRHLDLCHRISRIILYQR